MNQTKQNALHALLMGAVVPAILLNLMLHTMPQKAAVVAEFGERQGAENLPALEEEETVLVHFSEEKHAKMAMKEFLLGVVLGEMPAWFEPEALKAQAVAARTFVRKAQETGGKHGDGGVCVDPACCQAYCGEQEYLSRGGTPAEVEKVYRAVEETDGLVICYGDALIEATYYACSGGRTEDAQAVWGAAYPYLVSVDSPGEENAAFFTDAAFFSKQELEDALGVSLPEGVENWVTEKTYTDGGGVESVHIGTQVFRGTQLRTMLGLRSTAMTFQPQDDGLLIETKGYGHRVGMSQYGADAMAVAGSDFRQILLHYYPGTQLVDERKDLQDVQK